MAGTWCLTKQAELKFRKALKDGEITPAILNAFTDSIARRDFFAQYVGAENAVQVNALYESKLLLKNQQAGLISFAKRVINGNPSVRRDVISKIENLDKALNKSGVDQYLRDLTSKRIGADVPKEQAAKIMDLSHNITEAKTAMQADINNMNLRTEYGSRVYDMEEYLNSINPNKAHPLANALSLPRAMVASLDFVSAPFRHGFFAMSDPAWIKNYVRMPQLLTSEKYFRNRMGSIYGNKYYDAAIRSGLRIFKTSGDLSKQEEQFASNILNKFPITRGSKRGYTGFLNGLRMDMMSNLMKGAELRGDNINIGSKLVKDFATAVNNLTGAGSLGRFESATPEINLMFFSARMQMARINMMNPVTYLNPKTSGRARAYMLRNLIGSTAIAVTLLGLAKLAGFDIGTDPTSTHFGEINYGNIHIDVTGGNRVLIILLARLATGKYTSAAGTVTDLTKSNFSNLSRGSIVEQFLLGKLAPGAATMLSDFLFQQNGKDPFGNPVTIQSEIMKQLIPMNITNGMDMFNGDPTNSALGIVLGLFGLPVSVTKPTPPKDWNDSTSQALTQFHAKVGDSKFKAANDKFNSQYNSWLKATTAKASYKKLTPDEQQALKTGSKSIIQAKVLKSYGFTPTKAAPNTKSKALKPK